MNGEIIHIMMLPQNWKDRVTGRCKNYVGRNHTEITDKNVFVVHKCHVGIDVNAASEVNVFASSVGVKRRFHSAVFSNFCKYLQEELLAL